MNRLLSSGLLFGAIALVGGCAEDGANEVAVQEPVVEEPVAPITAEAPDLPGTSAVLQVETLADLGTYLTDSDGRAVYLLEGEPEGQSTCYEACAEMWPPFLAGAGMASAGAPEVQANLIGSLQRRDGSTQVTYGGHPLYYYQEDPGSGEPTGHDLTDQWGEWYLVQPTGEHLEEPESSGGGA